MTSGRAYRAPLERAAVLDELRSNAGTRYDPRVVKTFLEARCYEMPKETVLEIGGVGAVVAQVVHAERKNAEKTPPEKP